MSEAELPRPSRQVGTAVPGDAERREAPADSGLTGRALSIGLILVVGFTVACCFSVMLRYENFGTGYLPRGAVALLLTMLAGNVAARALRWLKLRLLSGRELMFIFLLLMVIGAIPNQEYGQHFYLNLIGIVYHATPPVSSPEVYLEELDPMLLPATDPSAPAIRWAQEGLPPGRVIPWRAWVVPLLCWTPFFLAVYWMVICFAAVLAHRWEAEEKLLYPLVQVPLEVSQSEPHQTSSVLRSPMTWIAFAIPVVQYAVQALHGYWPWIPYLELERPSKTVFTGAWSAFNGMLYFFRFDMIGISYLLSAEVSFSLWFFYILRRIEQMIRIMVGVNREHYQFFEMQCVGGYAALALALLWSARQHLLRAWRIALGMLRPAPDAADADEPYRVAVLGFLAALAIVIAWCVHFGLQVTWAVLQYALFPLLGMVVARVICEAGMFIYAAPFRLNDAIFKIAGTERIGTMNLTLMTMTSWCQIRSSATQNMAAVAQALCLGTHIGARRLHVMLAAMLAVTVAVLTCHVVIPYIIYTWGIPKLASWPSAAGLNTTVGLMRFIKTPVAAKTGDWVGMSLGAASTLALVVMRRRFVWWPLHPLGLITWIGWPIDRYWISILLGWVFKVMVLRLGGFKGFSYLRPIAFGLILGMNTVFTIVLILHFLWPAPTLMID